MQDPATASGPARSATAPITDGFGRVHDYVRIAVNERCNLRCIYCMPEEGLPFREGEALLSSDEITRVVGALAGAGVTKVRFTGGEPLLRRDLADLIARVTAVPGVESVHVTTNGILLADKAAALRAAGLHGVNVSLDTLDAAKFLQITRRAGVEKVLDSIREALRVGFDSVKVNVVALRGFNDDEIGAFTDLTRDDPLTVRFIELMPFDAHQIWKRGHFFSAEWIVEALRRRHPELPAASGTRTEEHVFRVPGHAGKVAVIPAYTRSLCPTCSRIRITADGQIRNCLYATDEYPLKQLLRDGGSDADVVALVRRAVAAKRESGWDAQKAAPAPGKGNGNPPPASEGRGSMTLIGG
jgi:cyclic pyranopterin phosphate synthase